VATDISLPVIEFFSFSASLNIGKDQKAVNRNERNGPFLIFIMFRLPAITFKLISAAPATKELYQLPLNLI